MFDLRAKRDLNKGFADAFGRGVDLALTPVVFGLLGWLVDRVAGTSPAFTLALAVVGTVGTAVKIKLGYDREMLAHAANPALAAPRQVPPAPIEGEGGR